MDRTSMFQDWVDLGVSPLLDAILQTGMQGEFDIIQPHEDLSEEEILQYIKRENFKVVIHENIPEEKDKCAICLEDYVDGEEIGKLDLCVHKFHIQCIKQWLMENNVCPICRRTALNVHNVENEVLTEDNNEDVNNA
ncbi:hypothetical protein Fmac_014747 [Flemingia macrophylla]|uniref:RING-type E3 ubiquitin transferase n=1 Tax=Flemingia macrophylla TaxID=520843 RepID=A0ABD1MCL1_9FABA